MKRVNCSYCKSSNTTIVNTYKHYWISCNDCSNVKRERKTEYYFNKNFFKSLIYRTQSWHVAKGLLPNIDVIKEEKKYYDYYYDIASNGSKGTKWEKVVNDNMKRLEKLNIVISGKNVLDISGGPGFLTYELKKKAKRAVLTEFSQHAVDGMAKALDVEAIKFDYNEDLIDEMVQGKFDVVFIIYSIGFCNDLPRFFKSLKKIMHKDSIVYICYSPPTLGLMLRWQFDDYTYNMCWTYETMAKCLAEIGMIETYREDEGSYAYDVGTPKTLRIVSDYFRNKVLNKYNSINRELIQKNILQVYKFGDGFE